MTKADKLILRLKSTPKDFSWDELVSVLKKLGFYEQQGNGSRIKFYHPERNRVIHLHKPHPAKILERYMSNEIIDLLGKEKLI